MDLWPHWDALECPVLLVRAGASWVLPEAVASEMQARLPNATVLTLDGASHGVLRCSTRPLADAMRRFLEGEALKG